MSGASKGSVLRARSGPMRAVSRASAGSVLGTLWARTQKEEAGGQEREVKGKEGRRGACNLMMNTVCERAAVWWGPPGESLVGVAEWEGYETG